MAVAFSLKSIFHRYVALPQDHGSWFFLISPLLIGLLAGRSWTAGTVLLVIAVLAGFLIRQPVTMLVKITSGRRDRRELPAALFWGMIYGLIGSATLGGLIVLGYGYLLYLALPGLPVFALHLVLVSRRAERRQLGVELVASGVLALAAPAGLWVGAGKPNPTGWLLWALVWLQSAASIVYAYLRLEQRGWKTDTTISQEIKLAWRALAYTTFNLILVASLALWEVVPPFLPLAYAAQWAEAVWGAFHPAVGWKPVQIGARQSIVSTLFTVLFILAWNVLPGRML